VWICTVHRLLGSGKLYPGIPIKIHVAASRDLVATAGVKTEAAYRRSYPSRKYKVLIGELTSELVLPEPRVDLTTNKELPMWAASVMQNTSPLVKTSPWVFVSGFTADTREKAGAMGLKSAQQFQQSYPAYGYKVLVGELTLEVVPPEMRVEFQPAESL
jgi:hypothetical protein